MGGGLTVFLGSGRCGCQDEIEMHSNNPDPEATSIQTARHSECRCLGVAHVVVILAVCFSTVTMRQ